MAKNGDIADVLFGYLVDAFLWVCKKAVKLVLLVCKYAWYLLLILIGWIISLFEKKKANPSEQNQAVSSEAQYPAGEVSE